MTHTPGPWTTDLDKIANDYEPEHIRVYSEGITRGGVNFRPEIAHVYFNNADNERQANAKLIAAAPELLLACQAVDHHAYDANENGDVVIPSYVWELISQAIDKATK